MESPRFQFRTSISNIAQLTKDFKFKNEYSKYIFEYLIKIGSDDENFPFEQNNEIRQKCNDKSYKVYLNTIVMYDYEKSRELKNKIIDETIAEYPNGLAYADALNRKAFHNSDSATLEILLNMLSENFYKDKSWKDAYMTNDGIFQKSFFGVIYVYIELKDIEKAKAYLKIAEEKFPFDHDINYCRELIKELETQTTKNK